VPRLFLETASRPVRERREREKKKNQPQIAIHQKNWCAEVARKLGGGGGKKKFREMDLSHKSKF